SPQPDFLALRMFWYRRRQNMKPVGWSGSPWLIGIWRFRPFLMMVTCAAPFMTASPMARPTATANRIHRAEARVRRTCGSYNDAVPAATRVGCGGGHKRLQWVAGHGRYARL